MNELLKFNNSFFLYVKLINNIKIILKVLKMKDQFDKLYKVILEDIKKSSKKVIKEDIDFD